MKAGGGSFTLILFGSALGVSMPVDISHSLLGCLRQPVTQVAFDRGLFECMK